jgi:hypothetical protein
MKAVQVLGRTHPIKGPPYTADMHLLEGIVRLLISMYGKKIKRKWPFLHIEQNPFSRDLGPLLLPCYLYF